MHAGVGVLDNSPLLIGVAANLSVVRGDKGEKKNNTYLAHGISNTDTAAVNRVSDARENMLL